MAAITPPTVILWAKGVSGNWTTATDWNPANVPGAADEASLSATGTYTVTSLANVTVDILTTAAGATLDIASGTSFSATDGTGTPPGLTAGKIEVADSASFEVGGPVDNTGTIALNSTGDATSFLIDGAVTLSGAGKVVLSKYAANTIAGDPANGGALTNDGNTISGAGTIGGKNLTLNNQAGTIDANSSNPLTIDTGNPVTNTGLMEASGGGMLVIYDTVTNFSGATNGDIEATGAATTLHPQSIVDLFGGNIAGGTVTIGAGALVEATGGQSGPSEITGSVVTDKGALLAIDNTILTLGGGTVNATGGVIEANDASIGGGGSSSTIVLDGVTITSGTLETLAGGIIETLTGSSSTLNGVTIGTAAIPTTVMVVDGSTLTLEGTIKIAQGSSLDVESTSGATIDVAAGTILSGAGTLILSDDTGNIVTGVAAGGKLTNDVTISGAGYIGDTSAYAGALTLVNDASGVIDATGAKPLTIDTAATVVNHGLIEATGAGGLVIESNVTNSGIIAVQDSSNVTINSGNEANGITNNTGNTIELNSTGDLTTLYIDSVVTLSGAGKVVLSNYAANTIAGDPVNDGTLYNFGNTISGAGQIGNNGDGSLTFENLFGTVDANSSTPLTIDTGNAVVANGLMEATGGGTLVIKDVVDLGDLEDEYGTIGNIEVTGAATTAHPASTIDLVGGSIFGNVIIGAGTVLEATGGALEPSSIFEDIEGVNNVLTYFTSVTDKGTLLATDGTSLTLSGLITATGGVIEALDGAVSSGAPSMIVLDGAVVDGGTLTTSAGGLILVQNNEQGAIPISVLNGVTISANSIVTVSPPSNGAYLEGVINNEGTIEVNAGTSGDSFVDLYLGAVAAASNVTLEGGGSIILGDNNFNSIESSYGAETLTNVDNIISGAGGIFEGNTFGTSLAPLTLINDLHGVIDATGVNAFWIATGTTVHNAGTLEATNPSDLPTTGGLQISDAVANSGTIAANGGNVTVTGALSGAGQVEIFGGNSATLGSSATNGVTFEASSANAELILNAAQGFSGKVTGFAASDSIDLSNFAFATTSITKITGTGAVGTTTDVTLTDSASHLTETLHLVNTTAKEFGTIASDYVLTVDHDVPIIGTLFHLA